MKLLKQLSVAFLIVAMVVFAVTMLLQLQKQQNEPPTILMDSEEIEMSVEDASEKILSGITASDKEDGDVSSSIVIEGISLGENEKERLVTVAAFDSNNNVVKATRKVTYTDYTPPVFSLAGSWSVPIGTEIEDIAQSLSAVDLIEGDISNRIRYYNTQTSEFNPNVAGMYSVVFSVSNEVGLTEEFVAPVEVYEKNVKFDASIELVEPIVYVRQGSEFDPMQYVSSITVDKKVYQYEDGVLEGDEDDIIFDDLEVTNPVNADIPGWYEVDYTVIYEDKPARTAYLLVRVQG